MSKKGILFLITVGGAISCLSQNKNDVNETSILPNSIYTYFPQTTHTQNNFNLNKKLNLKHFDFVYLDIKSIQEGFFTINAENIGKPPSKYIYDSYRDININQIHFSGFDLMKLPFTHR